jgi:Zn-dependent M16 (insulinase) family peptidase
MKKKIIPIYIYIFNNFYIDPSILPTITIEDIQKEKPIDDLSKEEINNIPIQWNYQSTNGIIYLHSFIDVSVPEEYLPYLPLFCQVLFLLIF